MKKKHQINTVQDMVRCTNADNLDNFLIDLKAVIEAAHSLQSLSDIIAELDGIPKEVAQLESKGFIWIDDNKHDFELKLGRAEKI